MIHSLMREYNIYFVFLEDLYIKEYLTKFFKNLSGLNGDW